MSPSLIKTNVIKKLIIYRIDLKIKGHVNDVRVELKKAHMSGLHGSNTLRSPLIKLGPKKSFKSTTVELVHFILPCDMFWFFFLG